MKTKYSQELFIKLENLIIKINNQLESIMGQCRQSYINLMH